MRHHAFLSILLCAAKLVSAQQASNIIEWQGDRQQHTYQMQQLRTLYAARERRVEAALQTVQGIHAYQEQCRQAYRALLGRMPERSPLQATVTGILQQEGYHIEKILYQSFPGHHVTASLYVPQGKGPFPAALLFCGHEQEAKATASYQQTAILLAKHGFVVLMPDPVSQGERRQLTGPDGQPLTRGGTTEHTLLNAAANLVGTTTAAYELWDNERGLDYLLSRKEVDPARIGCLGNSGGGTQTAYFMAYESRIKVAAVCSYITTRERTYELSGPLDGCVQLPGEGKAGLEIGDYMNMLAPKPLLILAGRYDFVDYTGAVAAYNETRRFYEKLGAPEQLQMITVDDGHGISRPKREAAVRWFRKWLCGDSTPVREGDQPVLTAAALNATATGQVNSSVPGEVTVQQHLLQTAATLAGSRKPPLPGTIKKLLAIADRRDSVQVEQLGILSYNNLAFEKYLLHSRNEPPLPFLSIGKGAAGKVMLYLHDEGKKALLDSMAQIKRWLDQGYTVVLPDLRGTGETADRPEYNNSKFYNREYRNAMSALHIGRPLPGQRVTDILLLLDHLRPSAAEITASGMTALIAQHAAVIDDRIKRIYVTGNLQSFTDIIRNIQQKDWYSYVIPGVLQYYDITDLTEQLQLLKK